MNYLDFEKNIGNKLANSRKEVNIDQLLKDLDIDKGQSRNLLAGYFPYMLVGTLLVSIFLLYQFNSVVLEHSASYNSDSNNSTELAIVPSEKSTIHAEKTLLASNKENINLESDEKIELKPIELKQETNTHKTTTKVSTADRGNSHPSLKTSAPKILAQEIKNESSNISSPFIIESREQNNEDLKSQNQTDEFKNKGQQSEKTEILASKDVQKLEEVEYLPALENELLPEVDFAGLPKLKGCPTFKDRLWSYSFIPEIGYTWPIKRLESKSSAAEDIFDERLYNEITLEGYQAAAYIEIKHNSGLYFKPGFSFSSITEQLRQTQVTRDSTRGVVEIIEVSPDTTILKYGWIYSESDPQLIKSHYNIKQYDIPLAFGYSHLLNGFALDFEAGVKLNLFTLTKGEILSYENEVIDLSNDDDYFKRKAGLGVFLGVNIKKQLNEFGEVYLSPRFQYNTEVISSVENPISQKYNSFGLHVGYVHTFAVR